MTTAIANVGERDRSQPNSLQHQVSVSAHNYTRGIDVHQVNLSGVGDCSIWEFSGHENYYMLYDHFIGNSNCIHVVMFNLSDTPTVQLAQVSCKHQYS